MSGISVWLPAICSGAVVASVRNGTVVDRPMSGMSGMSGISESICVRPAENSTYMETPIAAMQRKRTMENPFPEMNLPARFQAAPPEEPSGGGLL